LPRGLVFGTKRGRGGVGWGPRPARWKKNRSTAMGLNNLPNRKRFLERDLQGRGGDTKTAAGSGIKHPGWIAGGNPRLF